MRTATIFFVAALTAACKSTGYEPVPVGDGGNTTLGGQGGDDQGAGGEGATGQGGDDAGQGGSTGGAGGAGGSGGTGPQTPMDEWCAAVIPGYCKALYSCCTHPSVLDNWAGEADCTASLLNGCDFSSGDPKRIADLVAAGTATLDQARLATCVSDLEAQANSCNERLVMLMTRCYAAFQGNIPHGQPCFVPDDVGYAACDNGHCDGGICQAYVATGGDCSPPGAICDYTQGEACIADTTCGTPAAQGQSCTQFRDCLGGNCDVGGTLTCGAPSADSLCGSISN